MTETKRSMPLQAEIRSSRYLRHCRISPAVVGNAEVETQVATQVHLKQQHSTNSNISTSSAHQSEDGLNATCETRGSPCSATQNHVSTPGRESDARLQSADMPSLPAASRSRKQSQKIARLATPTRRT